MPYFIWSLKNKCDHTFRSRQWQSFSSPIFYRSSNERMWVSSVMPRQYPNLCALRELFLRRRSDGLNLGRRFNANGVKITWTLPIANSTLHIVLQGGLFPSLFLPVNGQWAMRNGQ